MTTFLALVPTQPPGPANRHWLSTSTTSTNTTRALFHSMCSAANTVVLSLRAYDEVKRYSVVHHYKIKQAGPDTYFIGGKQPRTFAALIAHHCGSLLLLLPASTDEISFKYKYKYKYKHTYTRTRTSICTFQSIHMKRKKMAWPANWGSLFPRPTFHRRRSRNLKLGPAQLVKSRSWGQASSAKYH